MNALSLSLVGHLLLGLVVYFDGVKLDSSWHGLLVKEVEEVSFIEVKGEILKCLAYVYIGCC